MTNGGQFLTRGQRSKRTLLSTYVNKGLGHDRASDRAASSGTEPLSLSISSMFPIAMLSSLLLEV